MNLRMSADPAESAPRWPDLSRISVKPSECLSTLGRFGDLRSLGEVIFFLETDDLGLEREERGAAW